MFSSIAHKLLRRIKSNSAKVAIGVPGDALDTMSFLGGFENPDRYEDTMEKIYADAKSDESLAYTLKHACLEENVAASFDFYLNSTVPAAVIKLMSLFGVDKKSAVVDVGCGRGHAAYALHKNGFTHLAAMDPNSCHATGTGYLASLPDHGIRIVNDIAEWRKINSQFDAALSTSTVHHWGHIPHGAIDLRRTLKPGGYWFMITEYFANNGSEFVSLLNDHPIAKRYGTYEWPYPASVYADLIQGVGFDLAAVIPLHYDSNKFYFVPLPQPHAFDGAKFTRNVDKLLRRRGATVNAFWDEVNDFRSYDLPRSNPSYELYTKRFYTNPQVMVFQRRAV
jgi:SAM-dependent methyltransferase